MNKPERSIVIAIDMIFAALLVILIFAMLNISGITLDQITQTATNVFYQARAFAN